VFGSADPGQLNPEDVRLRKRSLIL
jgi:hypothetical protein